MLCAKCIASSPRPSIYRCMKCAEPTSESETLCGNCLTLPPPLDRLVPIYRYSGPVRSAVHHLKYRGTKALAPVMAELMSAHSFTRRAKISCVVPVPQHKYRARERGYNQALLLAKEFADKLNLLLVEDGLEKIRATPSQVELNRHQRTMSLRGAIKAKYGFDGAHVLLIDDVATTGSTLMQCAFALNRANAKRVSAIVYAKEMSKDDS